jgi:hypothetical protein
MTPVLLYTDAQTITDEQTTLTNAVTAYQSIYNAVKAVGVTAPTLAEIDSLVQKAKGKTPTDFVNDYVVSKLVAQAGPFVINGVTLNATAVKNMILMPSTAGITTALNVISGGNWQNLFIGSAKHPRINLMSLAADVISAVGDANAQIVALFTFNTVNDASATIAGQLQAVCDALNTFNTSSGGIYSKRILGNSENIYHQRPTEIPGIAIFNNSFVVSVTWIRKFEQTGSVNFNE